VLWAQPLFSNGKCLQVEHKGFLGLPAHLVKVSKVVQALSRFRMLRSSMVLSNGEGALVERLGLLIEPPFWIPIPVHGMGGKNGIRRCAFC